MKRLLLAVSLTLVACSEQIQNSPETTGVKQTTTSAPYQTISIVAVGDIACSTSQREAGSSDCEDIAVANLARGMNPNYVFALGDIQYNAHSESDFQENFGKYWADMLPITKPVAGNHEYAMSGASGYFSTWTKYSQEGYYSFTVGDKWLVVALNTNDECRYVGCSDGSEQYEWLKNELTTNADRCVIALGHHPRFSSGAHGDTEAVSDIYDLMSSYDVSLYLSGHDHHYERIENPNSPRQYVVGTGGKDLRSAGNPTQGSAKIIDDSHGVLVMDIMGSTIHERFVSISGEILDSETTICYR